MTHSGFTSKLRRIWPVAWLAMAVVSLLSLALTFLWGIFSGGLDVEEACRDAGHPYDLEYAIQHGKEGSRWFPLHDKCNADYDLVEAWVNPALVILTVLTAAFLTAFIVTLIHWVKTLVIRVRNLRPKI
jgi:hypothetical protein